MDTAINKQPCFECGKGTEVDFYLTFLPFPTVLNAKMVADKNKANGWIPVFVQVLSL